MSSVLKTTLSAVLLFAAVPPGRTAFASTAEDTVDVGHLMEAYHRAVASHDGARLQALFVPEGSTWFKVLSDEGYARIRAKNPVVVKALPSSVQSFVEYVSTTRSSLNPQHSNVRIQSDGTIASVYFDFRFLIDSKEVNRGSESWQLVKGGDGWRIVSIVYSSTPPAV
jgi:hypothetical protein